MTHTGVMNFPKTMKAKRIKTFEVHGAYDKFKPYTGPVPVHEGTNVLSHQMTCESGESPLFRRIDGIQMSREFEGRVGDPLRLYLNIDTPYHIHGGLSLGPVRPVKFDPAPKSPLPAWARRPQDRPHDNAYPVPGPINTVPISNKMASWYLALLSGGQQAGELTEVYAVVSTPDSDERYLLGFRYLTRMATSPSKVVETITKGSVETHQLTVKTNPHDVIQLTFLDDDWVLLHSIRRVVLTGVEGNQRGYFKCDGYAGVAQAMDFGH